jgi:hypothetical protein
MGVYLWEEISHDNPLRLSGKFFTEEVTQDG